MPSSSKYEPIMDHEAVIIGAGPAGLFSAIELAKRKHDVRILEEHDKVGEPDHCAGLLSTTGLDRLGTRIPSYIIQNTVSGAKIYSPSGHSIQIERGRNEAKVIDRRKFDKWLAERAEDVGATLTTGAKVIELQNQGNIVDSIRIRSDRTDQVRAKIYIIAEGFRCQLSKSAGLPIVKKSYRYPAYQYEVAGVDVDDKIVEMFYGQNIAPGFFAWIIPLGNGRARIGLAARNRSRPRLDNLIQHHPIISKRMQGAKVTRSMGGVVLIGLPIKKMVTGNVLAVGDTAGMVKATTGGGVIVGGLTSRLAGKMASDALSTEDLVATLGKYDRQCKVLVSRELRAMYLAQLALSSLSDKGLDSFIKDAGDSGVLDIVKDTGDMDFQGKVIRGLLKDPRTLLIGLRAIRYINPFL